MTGKAASTDYLRKVAGKVATGGKLAVSDEVAATVQVESWLQKHAVKYAPPMMIPMSYIDERRSRQNQARKEPIVPDSVDRYTVAFRQGASFPPIVGYMLGGKFVIIDGNNRQAAARKAGLEEILAIMIAADTPSELIQYLTIEANSHHGKAPDQDWRIKQAFQLMGFGYDLDKAAEAVQVSLQTLKNARAAQEADQRARALKITGFSELTSTSKQLLNVLRDDPVFYHAGGIAVRTAMIVDDVRDMIKRIKAQRSEGDKLAEISKIGDERDVAEAKRKVLGRKATMKSPAHTLAAGTGMLTKIDPSLLTRQILTSSDKNLALQLCKALESKLLELQIALEELDLEGED